MKRLILAFSLVLITALSNFYHAPETTEAVAKPDEDLVVHEWGTFTTIAGKDGVAIDWRPLNGASDLPTFVYDINKLTAQNGLRGTFHDPGKGPLARVRMETPVIYFYTGREMEVDVEVNFPQGKITEWYPQAGVVNRQFTPTRQGRFESGINWGKIKLLPNAPQNFLREASFSHYYPARETDAVPVQVCNADKTKIETEKFLFYRGIGNFGLPLTVRLNGGKIALANQGNDAIKNLIVFENRGGKIGFRFVETLSKETIVERPEINQNLDRVLIELEKVLVAEGLYAKEARAMIETWRDSWFEEGLRVFYVLPTRATDEILPLKIEPRPKEIVRVLVGRAEVITPEMERDAKTQIGLLNSDSPKVRRQAEENLKKHGRFYEPVLRALLMHEKNAKVRAQIKQLINRDS